MKIRSIFLGLLLHFLGILAAALGMVLAFQLGVVCFPGEKQGTTLSVASLFAVMMVGFSLWEFLSRKGDSLLGK